MAEIRVLADYRRAFERFRRIFRGMKSKQETERLVDQIEERSCKNAELLPQRISTNLKYVWLSIWCLNSNNTVHVWYVLVCNVYERINQYVTVDKICYRSYNAFKPVSLLTWP